MPCLFALIGAFAPRIALVLLWLFTPLVNLVFSSWIWPLLGVIFLPFTTLLYVLLAVSGPMSFWGWLIVGMGLILDLGSYGQSYEQRGAVPMGSS